MFAKQGIDAQLILIRGGSTLVASLVTGEIQMAFTSGVSVLGAAAQGVDVKMLTSISSRVSWKLIANPQIKTAAELRGKRFGVQSIVGSTWMYAMLALEQLGLEPKRDNITFLPIGDLVTIGHSSTPAASTRRCSIPPLSRRLTGKGFSQLVDLAKTNASFPGLGVGVTRSYLDQQPATLEKVVTALTEGLAFVQLPANKPVVVKILMKHLRVTNPALVEDGYQDHLSTLNRKPYPSLDGLRSAQRLMAQQNPKIATLNWKIWSTSGCAQFGREWLHRQLVRRATLRALLKLDSALTPAKAQIRTMTGQCLSSRSKREGSKKISPFDRIGIF